MLGVFRVKDHYFTQTNYIFFNFRGRRVRPPPWTHNDVQGNAWLSLYSSIIIYGPDE